MSPTREDFDKAVAWLQKHPALMDPDMGYEAMYYPPTRETCESIVRVLWSRAGVDAIEVASEENSP